MCLTKFLQIAIQKIQFSCASFFLRCILVTVLERNCGFGAGCLMQCNCKWSNLDENVCLHQLGLSRQAFSKPYYSYVPPQWYAHFSKQMFKSHSLILWPWYSSEHAYQSEQRHARHIANCNCKLCKHNHPYAQTLIHPSPIFACHCE